MSLALSNRIYNVYYTYWWSWGHFELGTCYHFWIYNNSKGYVLFDHPTCLLLYQLNFNSFPIRTTIYLAFSKSANKKIDIDYHLFKRYWYIGEQCRNCIGSQLGSVDGFHLKPINIKAQTKRTVHTAYVLERYMSKEMRHWNKWN